MKSSPIIVIFIFDFVRGTTLPETTFDGNFLSENELLISNYDDNFEDRYEISEMNLY